MTKFLSGKASRKNFVITTGPLTPSTPGASVESVPEPSDLADVQEESDEVLRAAAKMAELEGR
jgi:hypothetical protein